MTNTLQITCDKFEDRIKEQKLAEKRGWCNGCYGLDKEKGYFVYYSKLKKKKRNSKK